MDRSKSWKQHDDAIINCEKCPRLRAHCRKVAREKRKSYATEPYWGRPIPGFGDHQARLVMIGLAPAAHGANRTGRMFTGDRSGDWLYRALFKANFANQPTSTTQNDGLALTDAFVTATAHCAPPGNKPTPVEIKRCAAYLDWEIAALKQARVYLAFGKIGFDAVWEVFKRRGLATGSRPPFGHGQSVKLESGRWLLASYHPSQQNTFTGKLTEPMFDSIFNQVKSLL